MKSKISKRLDPGLLLIAVFKLINGVLLIGVGIGALSLVNENLTDLIKRWATALEVREENETLQRLLAKAGLIQPSQLTGLSIVTFVYAAALLAMGVGLLLHKRWAEYLTIIVTASFIPFEIIELVRHFGVFTLLLLIINVLSVIYLIWRLLHPRK